MAFNAALLSSLWLKIIKIVIYLYNHISSVIIFGSINNNIINSNDSILNNTSINCFSLVSHREYLYLKIYRYRVYIYIL